MNFTSPRYTLIRTAYDNSKIQHEFKAETLTELLENIENFIRGSGFYIEGERLDFISEDDYSEDVFSLDGVNTVDLGGGGSTDIADIDLTDIDTITINLDENNA